MKEFIERKNKMIVLDDMLNIKNKVGKNKRIRYIIKNNEKRNIFNIIDIVMRENDKIKREKKLIREYRK